MGREQGPEALEPFVAWARGQLRAQLAELKQEIEGLLGPFAEAVALAQTVSGVTQTPRLPLL